MPDPTPPTITDANGTHVLAKDGEAYVSQTSPIGDVSIPGAAPVADEIKDNNVISTYFDARAKLWTARIGPVDRGITAQGLTAIDAASALLLQAHYGGWIFDPSWTPAS